MPSIGAAIRRERKARGLTLDELASRCGVSTAQLSKIENDKVDPSLTSLRRIAEALGAPLAVLVASTDTPRPISPLRPGDGFIFHRSGYDDSSVLEEFLHLQRDARMQPEIMTFPPGTTSGPALSHAGDEFFYVLEGNIHFFYGTADPIVLGPGHSLYFNGSIPHRWENRDGEHRVVMLLVSSPPTV